MEAEEAFIPMGHTEGAALQWQEKPRPCCSLWCMMDTTLLPSPKVVSSTLNTQKNTIKGSSSLEYTAATIRNSATTAENEYFGISCAKICV
jgi:hypothetical protein